MHMYIYIYIYMQPTCEEKGLRWSAESCWLEAEAAVPAGPAAEECAASRDRMPPGSWRQKMEERPGGSRI